MLTLYNEEYKYHICDWQNSSLRQKPFLFSKTSCSSTQWQKDINQGIAE
jgi:hypothetical protein